MPITDRCWIDLKSPFTSHHNLPLMWRPRNLKVWVCAFWSREQQQVNVRSLHSAFISERNKSDTRRRNSVKLITTLKWMNSHRNQNCFFYQAQILTSVVEWNFVFVGPKWYSILVASFSANKQEYFGSEFTLNKLHHDNKKAERRVENKKSFLRFSTEMSLELLMVFFAQRTQLWNGTSAM